MRIAGLDPGKRHDSFTFVGTEIVDDCIIVKGVKSWLHRKYIDVERDFWIEQRFWKPTQNIEQAFQVVRKMKLSGWNFKLRDDHKDALWYALFDIAYSDESRRYGTADTPELAICRAARYAIEPRVEGGK